MKTLVFIWPLDVVKKFSVLNKTDLQIKISESSLKVIMDKNSDADDFFLENQSQDPKSNNCHLRPFIAKFRFELKNPPKKTVSFMP